jgi:hypothetical protein
MRYSPLPIAMAFAVIACSKQEVPAAQEKTTETATVAAAPSPASLIPIKVYKTPTCGCCKAWVQHLEENGFKVEVMDMPDLSAVKAKYGVKPEMHACHTAVVNNYVVEGHVPADLILKMINEKPAIAGLAVPGMPMGSPGMESGGAKESYAVLSFDSTGKSSVYANR